MLATPPQPESVVKAATNLLRANEKRPGATAGLKLKRGNMKKV
jgi:hypothetical protein